MTTLRYYQEVVKDLRSWQKPCEYCQKKFKKGDIVEYIADNKSYSNFHKGHLIKWVNEKTRGFLLTKL